MLVNKMNSGVKQYEKRLKMRIFAMACMGVLGIISFAFGMYQTINGTFGHLGDFTNGFYTGGGAALFVTAIIQIVRNVRALKNEERRKRIELEENDERNLYIERKTWAVTSMIMVFVIYAAVLIAGLYNYLVFVTLVAVLLTFIAVLFVVFLVCRKIY